MPGVQNVLDRAKKIATNTNFLDSSKKRIYATSRGAMFTKMPGGTKIPGMEILRLVELVVNHWQSKRNLKVMPWLNKLTNKRSLWFNKLKSKL